MGMFPILFRLFEMSLKLIGSKLMVLLGVLLVLLLVLGPLEEVLANMLSTFLLFWVFSLLFMLRLWELFFNLMF